MNMECRYCLEGDVIENLVSPCKCSGTSKYIHPDCLNRWRNENIDNDFYNNCIECKSEYQYEYIKREYLYIPVGNNYKMFYLLLYGFGVLINSYIFNFNNIKYKNITTTYDNTFHFTVLVLISNISQNIFFYFGFLFFILFVRKKKLYIKRMYKQNLILMINFLQILLFLSNIFTAFVVIGIFFIAISYILNISYIIKHNLVLKQIDSLNIVYVTT